tara:strand:- start:37780 stop:38811 length:1032 start_codon:yes stop_codon:yes gene_type:complete
MSTYKKITISAIVACLIIIGFISYWNYSSKHPYTDDAYIQANIIQISPQITGKIKKVHVSSFDYVKKGDVLVSIDPAEYIINKNLADIKLDLAKQEYSSLENKTKALDKQISEKSLELDLAKKQLHRVQQLASNQQISQESLDKATTKFKILESGLLQIQYSYEETKTLLGDTTNINNNPKIELAQNSVERQNLLLGYTKIYAPKSGIVGKVNKVNPGNMIQAGQALFPLIEDNKENYKSWWIAANFKETQLQYVKPGQKAYISLDLYPGVTFTGHVASISPASGDSFSLLPPENATGNWIKITQRFPVKIKIDTAPKEYILKVGASANVTIDTNTYIDNNKS